MTFNVAQLKTFVAVAERGNISEAADHLGRTPSSVSMALKQLEGLIGGPLFEAGRKSALTPLGRYVLSEAQDEIARFDRMASNLRAFARNEAGQLGIACVPSVAANVLPAIVREFVERHPQVDIEVRDMDSTEVAWAVERNRVEIGIASPMPVSGNLAYTELLAEAFGVVARRNSDLARRRKLLTWRDLQSERVIASGLSGRIVDPAYRSIEDRCRLHVQNVTSLLAFVRNGLGVTLLPATAVAEDDPKLTVLPLAEQGVIRSLGILRRKDRTPSPVAHVFEEALVEAFAEAAAGPSRSNNRKVAS